MAVRRFPCGRHGRQRLQFFAAPGRAPIRAFAALVFPWRKDEVLLCDIADRGWCVPSGRVEPCETSLEAARREAIEEAGAILCDIQYIGYYAISDRSDLRFADCYVAKVDGLVEIAMQEESLGRRFVHHGDLPNVYYQWTPLTECVFQHSREVLQRLRDCR